MKLTGHEISLIHFSLMKLITNNTEKENLTAVAKETINKLLDKLLVEIKK